MRPLSKAQTEELASLARRHNGKLTADDVWKAAKHATSSLHGRFEWNVDVAAREFWRAQARSVLQLWVVVRDGKSERAVVSIRDADGESTGTYVEPSKITPERLVGSMINDLGSLVRRYSYLERIAPREYEEVVALHVRLTRKIGAPARVENGRVPVSELIDTRRRERIGAVRIGSAGGDRQSVVRRRVAG